MTLTSLERRPSLRASEERRVGGTEKGVEGRRQRVYGRDPVFSEATGPF